MVESSLSMGVQLILPRSLIVPLDSQSSGRCLSIFLHHLDQILLSSSASVLPKLPAGVPFVLSPLCLLYQTYLHTNSAYLTQNFSPPYL